MKKNIKHLKKSPVILSNGNDVEKKFLQKKYVRSTEIESAVGIFLEFLKGFDALDFDGPTVTVFGSARFKEGHPFYELTRVVGRKLAENGFNVITGGGPGLMEAANRGAKEANGLSMGCNIKLPKEQKPNAYLDQFVEFDHFFIRKVMLVKYSCAFIAMPGGFGTMDEAFETCTLAQNGKIQRFPIILMGTEYWKGLEDFLRNTLLKENAISEKDLDLIYITDSPDESIEIIRSIAQKSE